MTTLSSTSSPLEASSDQYVLMARQSYAILCYAANALESERPSYDSYSSFDHLADLVHAFLDRVVWADGFLDVNESVVLEALLDEDRKRRGSLDQRLGKIPSNPFLLSEVPEFIRACRRYDVLHGTRLEPAAVNALDSLGMALVASDRQITDAEFAALGESLAICHSFLDTRRGALSLQ